MWMCVISAKELWQADIGIADLEHLTCCEQFRLGESLAGQFELVLCNPGALLRLDDKDDALSLCIEPHIQEFPYGHTCIAKRGISEIRPLPADTAQDGEMLV